MLYRLVFEGGLCLIYYRLSLEYYALQLLIFKLLLFLCLKYVVTPEGLLNNRMHKSVKGILHRCITLNHYRVFLCTYMQMIW